MQVLIGPDTTQGRSYEQAILLAEHCFYNEILSIPILQLAALSDGGKKIAVSGVWLIRSHAGNVCLVLH